VGTLTPATGNGSDFEDQPSFQAKRGLTGYAALAMSENVAASVEDTEEDFGGLMVISPGPMFTYYRSYRLRIVYHKGYGKE
jgi:hypothetical protein